MGKKTRRNSIRKNKMRKMYGGDASDWFTSDYWFTSDANKNRSWEDWWQSLKSRTHDTSEKVYNEAEKAGNTVTGAFTGAVATVETAVKNVGSDAVDAVTGTTEQQAVQPAVQSTTQAAETETVPFGTKGGRRRRRRTKMRGGDFIPNSAFTNAMEVHDIQMASPQTLVGGRRRRCKSSRKIRKSRRSRSSRRH